MKTAMQELFSQLEIDQPQLFNINTTEGKTFVNGSEILASIPTSNGIIHVIGDVLLPK